MNKTVLIGRLTRDVELRNAGATLVARYTLAVDRKYKREGEQAADFIPCIAFGRNAEFAQKYLTKGKKIAIVGRIQTGSYTKQDGTKVYTTDVVVEEQEFVESKASEHLGNSSDTDRADDLYKSSNGFMSIPDNLEDDGLPFN